MKRRALTAVTVTLTLTLLLLATLPGETQTAVSPIPTIPTHLVAYPDGWHSTKRQIRPLVPGLNWRYWYETQSGYPASTGQFGAYVMQASGTNLFIGLGSARPAEFDGALIAVYDGSTLHTLGPLTEQGVNDMIVVGEILHVGGVDPCCTDGWNAGNHYWATAVIPPHKLRDPIHGLANVIHTWGLWANPNGDLYVAASAHEFEILWRGQVWHSTDQGQSWLLLSNLGKYRVYDVTGFQSQLYALYTNAETDERNTLAVSPNGGHNWNDLIITDLQRVHLTEFGGQLVGVRYDRTAVYALTAPNTIIRYQLPAGYTLGSTYDDAAGYANYNLLAVAGPYLYTVLENSAAHTYTIVRTRDLQTWDMIATTQTPVIALAYWPAKNWLIGASNGRYATLWQIDLSPSS